MRSFRDFVDQSAELLKSASKIELGSEDHPIPVSPPSDSPAALIFSPHPDDECINGGLALRLRKEAGWKIINVAVTLGSDPQRKGERLSELENACRYLGFENLVPAPLGFENVSPNERELDTPNWTSSVAAISSILSEIKPSMIIVPHADDHHPAHCGTNLLVMDAVRLLDNSARFLICENEFWHPMCSPNILIELSREDVAELITALSFHVGEIRRNPYHLTLPAWLIDNVRRGSEIVGGAGEKAQKFTFGNLNRFSVWENGRLEINRSSPRFLPADADIKSIFASQS